MKSIVHIFYLLVIGILLVVLILPSEPTAPVTGTESPEENAIDWSRVYRNPDEDYYDRNLTFLGTLQSIENKAEGDPDLGILLGKLTQAVKKQNWEMFEDPRLVEKLDDFFQKKFDLHTRVANFLCLDIEGEMADPPPATEVVNQLVDIWFVGFSPYSDTEIILFGYVKLKSGVVMKSLVIVDIAVEPYELSVFMG